MKKPITTPKRTYVLSALFLLTALITYAATIATGSIKGKVLDEKGEGMIGASVVVIDTQSKSTGLGAACDIDGNYEIHNLQAGNYNLRVVYVGYQTQVLKGVKVTDGKPTMLNFNLKPQAVNTQDVVIQAPRYEKKLSEETVSMEVIRADDVKNTGSLTVENLASSTVGVTQTDAGQSMTINGGREGEVQYVVNSRRLQGKPNTTKAAPSRLYNQQVITAKKDMATRTETNYDMKAMDMEPVPAPDMHTVPGVKPEPIDKTGSESYQEIKDNKFLSAQAAPLSTFSIDVDVASYGITRRKITEGTLPPKDAVRIEEMVNYFPYSYADPTDGKPFAVHTEFADCPWDQTHKLLRIGIQGKHIKDAELPANNLVFLIDVSGSMYSSDKLPLVQQSLGLLVDKMRDKDRIALVVYAGSAGLVLPSTSGTEKEKIKAAINKLTAGGSTAGGAGIELAYKTCVDNLIKDGNNRVLLCTDGDFNVGINGATALESFIAEKRKTGVALSVLGFGMGNYKDHEMEVLADKGNGNYAYIDNEKEAKKNLVTQMAGTLNTIAKDVKIQAVFNPACVKSYRLIGYENRHLENRDFANDKIDAGEIGAGTAVTAVYEVVLGTDRRESTVELEDGGHSAQMALTADDLMALRIRYKAPTGDVSQLMESHVSVQSTSLASTSADFRFAASVAEFGMLLRDSPYKGDATYDKVKALAKGSLGADHENYRRDFVTMIDQAHAIASRTALK